MKSFVQTDVQEIFRGLTWTVSGGWWKSFRQENWGKFCWMLFSVFLWLKLDEGRGIDRANRLRQWIIDSLSPHSHAFFRHQGINKTFVHHRYSHNLLFVYRPASLFFSVLPLRSLQIRRASKPDLTVESVFWGSSIVCIFLHRFTKKMLKVCNMVFTSWLFSHTPHTYAFCKANKMNLLASWCQDKLPNIQIMYANYCWLLLINVHAIHFTSTHGGKKKHPTAISVQ